MYFLFFHLLLSFNPKFNALNLLIFNHPHYLLVMTSYLRFSIRYFLVYFINHGKYCLNFIQNHLHFFDFLLMIPEIFFHQLCLSFLKQLKMCLKEFVIFKFDVFFQTILLFYQIIQFSFQIFSCIFRNLSINLASNILHQNHYLLFLSLFQHSKLVFLLNLAKDLGPRLHMVFFSCSLLSSFLNSILFST